MVGELPFGVMRSCCHWGPKENYEVESVVVNLPAPCLTLSMVSPWIGFCLFIYNHPWLLNFGESRTTLASFVFRWWNRILSSGQASDPVGTEICSRFHREAVKRAVRFLAQFARLEGATDPQLFRLPGGQKSACSITSNRDNNCEM